jgi:hypothetical protein
MDIVAARLVDVRVLHRAALAALPDAPTAAPPRPRVSARDEGEDVTERQSAPPSDAIPPDVRRNYWFDDPCEVTQTIPPVPRQVAATRLHDPDVHIAPRLARPQPTLVQPPSIPGPRADGHPLVVSRMNEVAP